MELTEELIDLFKGGEAGYGVDGRVEGEGFFACGEEADLAEGIFVITEDMFAGACDGDSIEEVKEAGGEGIDEWFGGCGL